MIIVTNWDRFNSKNENILKKLEQDLKIPIIAVDARKITEYQKSRIFEDLENPQIFSNKTFHTGISIRPKSTILEKKTCRDFRWFSLTTFPCHIISDWS